MDLCSFEIKTFIDVYIRNNIQNSNMSKIIIFKINPMIVMNTRRVEIRHNKCKEAT